jgi:guanylate kinase
LFVISGPSGVGKGTVVRRIRDLRPDLVFSVSFTTRSPRPGEVDGVHYRFVSETEFDRMIDAAELLEWASVFGHRSGTSRGEVDEALTEGRDVLKEMDVQGAAQIRERMPQAVLIFLAPPSEDELARRLRERGTEEGPALERRLAEARRELAQATWFDHIVMNDELEAAVGRVLAIIDAGRTSTSHDSKERT